jgi:hypothetical protein
VRLKSEIVLSFGKLKYSEELKASLENFKEKTQNLRQGG